MSKLKAIGYTSPGIQGNHVKWSDIRGGDGLPVNIDTIPGFAAAAQARIGEAIAVPAPPPVVFKPLTSTDLVLKSLGLKVPSVPAPAAPVQPPVPVVLKTPAPKSTDLTLKSLGLEAPGVKVSSPAIPSVKTPAGPVTVNVDKTIFAPCLNRSVKATEIANVNPSIDIQEAEHCILIHDDVKIEQNKQTGELTRPFSTGHRNVEFVAKGKSEGVFGKQPYFEYIPMGLGKIEDESERLKLAKEHSASLLRTKIIPVTKEQYDAAYNYAKKQQDSGVQYFNIVNNNCNDFVNDVLKQAMPDQNLLGQIYTGKELEGGRPVNMNLTINYGASDRPYTVSESIHMSVANVADKHNVPKDRVVAGPVNPDTDIMHFTILPSQPVNSSIIGQNNQEHHEVGLSGDN